MFPVLQPGTPFADRYLVEQLLRAGGMGAVYIVRHRDTMARLALKVMHPGIVEDPVSRARFAQEARVASIIESTHVVTVTDAGIDGLTGLPFLVMELLRGEEVGDLLARRGRLSPPEVIALLAQVARALDKAHLKGIVHRDLKPENLFVVHSDEEGPKVKVLDFGIAKILEGAHKTTVGGGTPLYMAPEQALKTAVSPATDIFALGLCAYTMLVGHSFWEATSLYDLFSEVVSPDREAATVRARKRSVIMPPALDAWFARCTATEPGARFPRASEAIVALGAVFGTALGTPIESRAYPLSIPPAPAPSIPPGSVDGPSSLVPSSLVPSFLPPPPPTPTAPVSGESARWKVAPPSFIAPPSFTSQNLRNTGETNGVRGRTLGTAAKVSQYPNRLTPAASAQKPKPIGRAFFMVISAVIVVGTALVFALLGDPPRSPEHKVKKREPSSNLSSAEQPLTGQPSAQALLRGVVEAIDPFVPVGKLMVQRHEVSREAYSRWIMSLSEPEKVSARPLRDWKTEMPDEATRRRPVTWVTHARALRFCAGIQARLPSSDEWSAIVGTTFPWGDAWPPPRPAELAIGRGDDALPAVVESSLLDRSKEGVFDLLGNVREWTSTDSGGFAIVRGASVTTPLAEGRGALTSTSQKDAVEGERPLERAEEIAAGNLGFRCVR